MKIDIEVIRIRRQWRATFKKIALVEGLGKAKKLVSYDVKIEEKESYNSSSSSMQNTGVEIILDQFPKEKKVEATNSGEVSAIVNVELEEYKEFRETEEDLSEVEEEIEVNEGMEDIRIIADSKEIMPVVDIISKKFEYLEELLKEKYDSISIDSSR